MNHLMGKLLAIAWLAAGRLVFADPAPAAVGACDVGGAQEAKTLADLLYEKGDYQRAGECYEAAGDPSHAQLAFLKAVGPNSKAAARGLGEQRDAAKALIAQVQQAFGKKH